MNKKSKNLLILLLTLAAALQLFACAKTDESPSLPTEESAQVSQSESKPEESAEKPAGKPEISIKPSQRMVIINKGEDFDLLKGISAADGEGKSIIDKINIDKGKFDSEIPGVYEIKYTYTDESGNSARPVKRRIRVKETVLMKSPEVFEGIIENEIKNPAKPKIFGGAWYRKVVSSKDKWCGIEGVIKLPEVKLDRYKTPSDKDVDPNVPSLDNPSVYLGGFAETESDVGLSFSRALVDVQFQKLSKGCIAFRPFWRYITSTDKDEGDYTKHDGEYAVSANGKNCIANYHWRYTEYYYLPGDIIRMSVHCPEKNKMQLQIEVIEKSSLPSSVKIREEYGWNDPADFISPLFTSPGQGCGYNAEFKRVNAIDQSGNEGKTALDTNTLVSDAVWYDTYLYREIDGELYKVPMTDERKASVCAPYDDKFTISNEDTYGKLGGEVITIHPGYSEK